MARAVASSKTIAGYLILSGKGAWKSFPENTRRGKEIQFFTVSKSGKGRDKYGTKKITIRYSI